MRSSRLLAISTLALAAAGCAISQPSFKLGGPEPGPRTIRGAAVERDNPAVPSNRIAPQFSPHATQSQVRAGGTTIEVREGDTLLEISRKYNVPVSVLVGENRLNDLNVFPGMRLFIPKL